jgi:hypothetical protein
VKIHSHVRGTARARRFVQQQQRTGEVRGGVSASQSGSGVSHTVCTASG